MFSVCCLSNDVPRLAALLELFRPVAGELVVAVDDRVDARPLSALADLVFTFPFAEPADRARQWLHEQTTGDWVFWIDGDEAPSRALLDAVAAPPSDVTHCYVPRRWLWRDGWLDEPPWRPDWQLRLVRKEAARFPGRTHIGLAADGPRRYLEAPLYHLDLLLKDRIAREEQVRRFDRARPGLRLGGRPLNEAYYLPESRDPKVAPIPEEDAAIVDLVLRPQPPNTVVGAEPVPARREEIDARWAERSLPESAYRASLELVDAPESLVAGEVCMIDVRVTNLGSETLPRELPEIRLAYQGLPSQLRTQLPHDLPPGEVTLVPVALEAPEEPGVYVVEIDLVHERHRWFRCGVEVQLEVVPRRRVVILVGQPPGDAAYDAQIEGLLATFDPTLEPLLVGPKPDWLRDRFGVEAAARPPTWRPDAVRALPGSRRYDRIRLRFGARRLRRRARG
jgi:hypothetical protein